MKLLRDFGITINDTAYSIDFTLNEIHQGMSLCQSIQGIRKPEPIGPSGPQIPDQYSLLASSLG